MMILKMLGYIFIEFGEGFLVCGYVVKGWLEEFEVIIVWLEEVFLEYKLL